MTEFLIDPGRLADAVVRVDAYLAEREYYAEPDAVHAAEIPVFVKQLGTTRATGHGRGNHPDTWPGDLRIRAYPAVTA